MHLKPFAQIKNAFTALLLLGIVSLSSVVLIEPAFSQSKYPLVSLLRCSRDQSILEAFNVMVGSSGEQSLAKIVRKPVRVLFKDLGTLNKKLKNFDALSWLSFDGEQVIFINEKHRNAPPQALAAIIAHEAMHDDQENSLQEELSGWKRELAVWLEMKAAYPALASIPTGAYPLVDRLNKIEEEDRSGTLEKALRNNPGYKGLPERSTGF